MSGSRKMQSTMLLQTKARPTAGSEADLLLALLAAIVVRLLREAGRERAGSVSRSRDNGP